MVLAGQGDFVLVYFHHICILIRIQVTISLTIVLWYLCIFRCLAKAPTSFWSLEKAFSRTRNGRSYLHRIFGRRANSWFCRKYV